MAAMTRVRLAASGFLVLIALALLVSLGTWQMHRMAWKEGLIADIESRRHQPPASVEDIDALARSGGDVDYRAMTASGTYLNDKERRFLATYDGDAGFYIYTPLQLADGHILFVNRGFVPEQKKEPSTRMGGQLLGLQRVTGLARAKLTEKPSRLVPDNDIAKNVFYWKDLDAMAASTGIDAAKVLPFFLDAGPSPVPGGLPIGGVTMIDLPNSHLQYALTWYGLALALAVIAVISVFRKKT
ncbi:SURF1 family protein [Agrobacterium vitis]|uniref:SURF1-like protein n=1 Tax=Agrobacterium vitis TaxID=373 RepID=A0ABD6G942_AGRVI|nr:SURF1 family protein [Agrobacterium vitis]MUO79232.1 SURF1 family protein [Agrobacterium vitis]MUO95550.1 SURF1 family protein [Agrobacterium vitis]MUP05880.1 SURF1 family protein [Agrobacterium vitis]MUZ82964.1 SURF1 family protein [Agrobacterium vitis]MVA11662.1 SURF1 family protein [Agrobacterium vitis]